LKSTETKPDNAEQQAETSTKRLSHVSIEDEGSARPQGADPLQEAREAIVEGAS
jgi:hypothetical protein